MSKQLSAFEPLPGYSGVYTAQNGNLRCTAIRLRSGGLCLYSPVSGLGDTARESLQRLGDVTHLLAPNHYHNKALPEYSAAFPQAPLCCTIQAMTRLKKQTSLDFKPLNEAEISLPSGVRFVEPVGLKTGEVWVEVASETGRVWIVTDAFRGPKTAGAGYSKEPELLGTFPTFGIKDRTAYHGWLAAYVGDAHPTMIVPCHGSIIQGYQLGAQALGLVKDLL